MIFSNITEAKDELTGLKHILGLEGYIEFIWAERQKTVKAATPSKAWPYVSADNKPAVKSNVRRLKV